MTMMIDDRVAIGIVLVVVVLLVTAAVGVCHLLTA